MSDVFVTDDGDLVVVVGDRSVRVPAAEQERFFARVAYAVGREGALTYQQQEQFKPRAPKPQEWAR